MISHSLSTKLIQDLKMRYTIQVKSKKWRRFWEWCNTTGFIQKMIKISKWDILLKMLEKCCIPSPNQLSMGIEGLGPNLEKKYF